MRKKYRYCFVFIAFIFAVFFSFESNAQGEVINNMKTALKSGSSKELAKVFNTIVEINFDGEKRNYSRSQAELVLKEFFKKYAPTDFQLIHQGASKKGLVYVIGKYSYENGSFRIVIFIKKFDDKYLVDLIEFSKE